jgi:competence protein ComEA
LALVIHRPILGCLLGLTFIGQVGGQSLPAGKGRAEFERICGMCHRIEIATKLKQSADQWSATVDDMVNQGAEGTDDEFELIVNYLATNFGNAKSGRDSAGKKINVNAATARELTDVLGLSSSDAEAIVQYRKEKGAFKDWPELRKVPGIDLKKLEDQKDRIAFTTVRDPAENPK